MNQLLSKQIGNKSVKRQGETIWFLSPKAFKKYPTANIIGYVDLKKKSQKRKPYANLIVGDASFPVYKKKGPYKRSTGYIMVSDTEYIGLERANIECFLLILFLLVFLFSLCAFCNRTHPLPENKDWTPVIDENTNKVSSNKKVYQKAGSIEVAGFSRWHIPSNTKENLPALLENPVSNNCYFTFTVTENGTEKILYQSKQLAPGDTLFNVNFSKAFQKGEYPITILIQTNDIETGSAMNSCKLEATLVAD